MKYHHINTEDFFFFFFLGGGGGGEYPQPSGYATDIQYRKPVIEVLRKSHTSRDRAPTEVKDVKSRAPIIEAFDLSSFLLRS